MNKRKNVFEIYLNSKTVTQESWLRFIQIVSRYIGYFRSFKIIMIHDANQIKYYIITKYELPPIICDLEEFLIKKIEDNIEISYDTYSFYLNNVSDNFADIIDKEEFKKNNLVKRIEIKIRGLSKEKILSKSFIYFEKHNKVFRKKLLITIPSILLSIDFAKNVKYSYKKPRNYLDIQKTQHLFYTSSKRALLKIDAFPYLQGDYYLNQNSYDFDKHSMIVGSSGSGKSKFISLFIKNLCESEESKFKYKVIVIDPHASLVKDIGGLASSKVLNFESLNSSLNLFMNDCENVISSTEMIMSILKSLISDNYNLKLERVLRYSVHLLVMCNKFNFKNLRKLLLNSEYRNIYIKELNGKCPSGISEFFLTEFLELKTKYYNEAISPIISFIDEMELLPVFEKGDEVKDTLNSVLNSNFLTLFSLSRVYIGDKGVKTVSSLIMQQLMQFIQSRKSNEHIILIIDEVSVVENPILMSFLSEARKYNLSIILSQQYFNQITRSLQSAIFANVMNYYIFRVSKNDASLLTESISMKIPKKDTSEEKIDMLVNLNNRECIARICDNGIVLPVLKGKTIDFIPNPLKEIVSVDDKNISIDYNGDKTKKKFELNDEVKLLDLLLDQSSSRKDIR